MIPLEIRPEIINSLDINIEPDIPSRDESSPENFLEYKAKIQGIRLFDYLSEGNWMTKIYFIKDIHVGHFFDKRGLGPDDLHCIDVLNLGYTDRQSFPDAVYRALKMDEGKPSPLRMLQVDALLEQFARLATMHKNWQTAVNALDVLSGGKLLEDENAMSILRDAAQKDRLSGIEIARAIEARLTSNQARTVN